MPVLLIVGLGRGDTKRHMVQAFLDSGFELVVLTGSVPGWIGSLARRAESTDMATDGAVRRGIALGLEQAVDGVITFDEAYVELAAGIGEGLGVPSLGREAARLCRDKFAMRRQFSRAGIPSAMCAIVRTADEAMRAAASIGYPVVLKPRNLGGSVGVVRADTEDEVSGFFQVVASATIPRFSVLPGVLVEEYIEGPEVSVESVAAGGVVTVCGITEKQLGFAPFFEEVGHLARPVRPADPLDRQLTEMVRAVHGALGITVGVTHCEIRLAADGLRVIEIGARLAGDHIPEVTRLASGIDLIAAACAVATGQQPDLRPTTERVAGIRMVYPSQSGLITRLAAGDTDGLLAEMGWYAAVGQRVMLPPAGFLSRLAYLIAAGESREEVTRRLDAAEAALDIEIAPHGTADGSAEHAGRASLSAIGRADC